MVVQFSIVPRKALLLAMALWAVFAVDEDQKLKAKLFASYSADVLPSLPLNVSMQINILSIETLDIVTGTAKLSVFLRSEWIDPALTWNPSDYGGQEYTYYPTEAILSKPIYVPEIYCSTCLSNSFTFTRARGNYTGGVFWSRYGTITILVPFSVENFPYDSQTIGMNFYLWGLPRSMIALWPMDPLILMDPENYISNVEWDITEFNHHVFTQIQRGKSRPLRASVQEWRCRASTCRSRRSGSRRRWRRA